MVITFTGGTKPEFQNRRAIPRWNTQGHCVYRVNNDSNFHEGYVKDISCTGTCLVAGRSILINQKIHLTIHISDCEVIKVSGKVLWKRVDGREHLIGIRFFNASCETEDTILQYALYTSREKLVNHWFDGWVTNSPNPPH